MLTETDLLKKRSNNKWGIGNKVLCVQPLDINHAGNSMSDDSFRKTHMSLLKNEGYPKTAMFIYGTYMMIICMELWIWGYFSIFPHFQSPDWSFLRSFFRFFCSKTCHSGSSVAERWNFRGKFRGIVGRNHIPIGDRPLSRPCKP